MKVSISSITPSDLEVDTLVVPVPDGAFGPENPLVPQLAGKNFSRMLGDFSGLHGEVLLAYPEEVRAKRVLFVGLGADANLTSERIRRAVVPAAGLCIKKRTSTLGMVMPQVSFDAEELAAALVEGFVLSSYTYVQYKTADDERLHGPDRIVIQASDQEPRYRRGSTRGKVMAEATMFARDMVNLAPGEKTATDLARMAERSASRQNYYAEVWDRQKIEEEGMGGLLAVNRGSTEPPTFTILEWHPDNAQNERPVVLIGKGIVYDTGGLSLKKTSGSMDQMKCDMAGAAAVIAAMEAVSRLELPVYVVALIPATDNRPGPNAYVPGEVIRMHSEATVEVLNTDAEGRLIIADALSFAKTFRPQLVIDVATLTGAQKIALGSMCAAVFTNHMGDSGARTALLKKAGTKTGDYVADLPLYDDYADLLKSDVADLKNVGGKEGGLIVAAKFLEHFVDFPWIHIDIAGPAFLEKSFFYRPKGGTGFGVRLLVEYLRGMAG